MTTKPPWAGGSRVQRGRRWWDDTGYIPPSEGAVVAWWDGASMQAAEALGWATGDDVAPLDPVEVLGWWDGSTIQPLASLETANLLIASQSAMSTARRASAPTVLTDSATGADLEASS